MTVHVRDILRRLTLRQSPRLDERRRGGTRRGGSRGRHGRATSPTQPASLAAHRDVTLTKLSMHSGDLFIMVKGN